MGYENIMRDRDGLDPSVFNQVSKDVCMDALANMQDMDINVCFDKNPCPINFKDKPPGYYITCNDSGEMIGQFNEKSWNSIKNKWNDAEPLCANPSWTQSSITTAAPNGCADDSDCDDSDTCTRDKCSKTGK